MITYFNSMTSSFQMRKYAKFRIYELIIQNVFTKLPVKIRSQIVYFMHSLNIRYILRD